MAESEEIIEKPKVLTLLKSSIGTLTTHGVILVPFVFIAFIQLLVLEILYFIPRWPLNQFFGPVIRKLWSETFMHYPINFSLLPKLFQYAQVPIFILFSSFLIGVSIRIIYMLNNEEEVRVGAVIKGLLPTYIYILCAALLSYGLMYLFFKGYGLVYARALEIRSVSGPFFWLKNTIVHGAPYFSLLLSIIGTTLFAYVIPLLVIEKRKLFSALIENFKLVFTSPFKTFFLVFFPSIIYALILLLRNEIPFEGRVPELRAISIVISIFVTLIIDAVVYTALTTYFLIRRGN